jgi:hypothetical protein
MTAEFIYCVIYSVGSKGNVNETFRETLGLEITVTRRIICQDSKNGCQYIMEGSCPSETKEEMRAGQELLKEEMLAKLDAHHERMMARTNSQLEEMEVCLGKMEATNLEASPEPYLLSDGS